MRKSKKLLAILLIGILATSILAGCQKETKNENGITTLRVAFKDTSISDERQKTWFDSYNKALQNAGIPAKLEVVEMQSGSYQDNLSLMLNSGDIPDIIYFQGGDQVFADQGVLEDMTPYIRKSKNLKNVLEDFQKERMKNYPYLLFATPALIPVPVIRTDVLKSCEFGQKILEEPTVENYTALFEELKKKHNSVFGLDGNLKGINTVFDQAFGLTETWLKTDDGFVYNRVSEQALEELKYYAELYKKGIIDADYVNATWETKENNFYSGNSAIISGNQGAVIDIYHTNQTAANGEQAALTVLPPAKGIGQGYLPLDVSKESRGFAISSASEHKDLAFQVLDFAASEEGRKYDLLGVEGKQYEINDGKYTLLEDHNNWCAKFFETFNNFDMENLDPETPYWSEPAMKSKEMSEKYMTMDNAFVIPEEKLVKWDAAETLLGEFTADFVMGNKTEKDWNKFVSEWMAAGGKEITEYANSVLQ